MLLWKGSRLRLRLTALGIQYLVAMLMVGGFAANTGNNLLYLIFGLMLGLFLVSGMVSRRALRNLDVAEVEAGNLFAQVRGGLRVRLREPRPKAVRGLELHVELEEGRAEPTFYPGGLGEAAPVAVVHARIDRRGWTRLKALTLRTIYPFGFLEKAWRIPLDQKLLVLPHPRAPGILPATEPEEGHGTLALPGESSPEGARPLRQGDPPARVHWKRTAQRSLPGRIHPWVRTFQEEQPLGLHLDLDLTAWAPGALFERELERLSGAILQARLQKREVSLELRDGAGRRYLAGHTPCWRALAEAKALGRAEAAHGGRIAAPG